MDQGRLSSLTRREKEILQQMGRGISCRDIAGALSISELTVKTHRRNMLAKVGLRNAAQLLAHARTEGVLPSGPSPPRG
jgi:DNA-binding CsgD family transcriptional regulator